VVPAFTSLTLQLPVATKPDVEPQPAPVQGLDVPQFPALVGVRGWQVASRFELSYFEFELPPARVLSVVPGV
jgi:hypothetical protein